MVVYNVLHYWVYSVFRTLQGAPRRCGKCSAETRPSAPRGPAPVAVHGLVAGEVLPGPVTRFLIEVKGGGTSVSAAVFGTTSA